MSEWIPFALGLAGVMVVGLYLAGLLLRITRLELELAVEKKVRAEAEIRAGRLEGALENRLIAAGVSNSDARLYAEEIGQGRRSIQ